MMAALGILENILYQFAQHHYCSGKGYFIYGLWDNVLVGLYRDQHTVFYKSYKVNNILETGLYHFFSLFSEYFLQINTVPIVAIGPWKGHLGLCLMESFHNAFFDRKDIKYSAWDSVFSAVYFPHFIVFHDGKKYSYLYHPQSKVVQEMNPEEINDFLDTAHNKNNIFGDQKARVDYSEYGLLSLLDKIQ